MKHIDIIVKGKVQGVFFRKFTQLKANELGVLGTVKNNEDSSVSIEAEGCDEDLKLFINWCHEGSPGALVNEVLVEENECKNYTNFSIIR